MANAVDGQEFWLMPQEVDLPPEVPVMTDSEKNQLQDQLRKVKETQMYIVSF